MKYNYQNKEKVSENGLNKAREVKKYVIPKFSEKQLNKLAEFRKVRNEYMKDNPICEFPNCENPSTDLHHGAGKVGKLLTDKRYFKALDREHHRWCELNPLEAQKLGLSFKRLDK